MYTGQEITHGLTKTPYLTLPESSGQRKKLVISTVQFATSSGLGDLPKFPELLILKTERVRVLVTL